MTTPELLSKNLAFITGKQVDLSGVSIVALVDMAAKLNIPIEDLFHCDLDAKRKAEDIRMVVMDCDGVLTNGGMTFTSRGEEIKQFNVKDGMGIKMLQNAGLLTGIISSGIDGSIVEHRAKMLGIPHVYVGKKPKLEILDSWLDELGFQYEQIAYIGDDLTDLPIIQVAGFTACPADAVSTIRREVDVVLPLKGGEGCVREWVDRYWDNMNL